MAATVSPWGKPGAWAMDAEENESELLKQRKEDAAAGNDGNSSKGGDTTDFPSLAAGAATKTKKKKPQKLSLQEFTTLGADKPVATQSKGLTPDELFMLPTGPRQRSPEELDRNKLGGGFRSYGGGLRDEQPRRQGGFNREPNREVLPSRADEIDNWAAGKKSPASSGFERRDRGERGGFFSEQSRADEVDNWASSKSFVPSEPRRYDRRGSFGLESNSGGGADSGNWIKRKEEEGQRMGGAFDSLRSRRGGESNDPDLANWGSKREEGSAGGRPRLNLQPRTLPVGSEVMKDGTPGPVKPKGSNPFGEARPREEVLKEKGQDWKEIEEKLESNKLKEVVPAGRADGPARRGFWGGNGRDSLRQEDKTERAWKRPQSVGSRPQSAAGSESGLSENGHAERSK